MEKHAKREQLAKLLGVSPSCSAQEAVDALERIVDSFPILFEDEDLIPVFGVPYQPSHREEEFTGRFARICGRHVEPVNAIAEAWGMSSADPIP